LARYSARDAQLLASSGPADLTGLFGGLVWFLAAYSAERWPTDWAFRRSLSLAYLILSCSYFLLGSIGSPWLAPVRNAMPLVVSRGASSSRCPRFGHRAGQTLRRGHHGARLQGKCPLHRLFHLLHARERRRSRRPLSRLLGAPACQRRKRISAWPRLSVFLMFFLVLLLFQEPTPLRRGADRELSARRRKIS
jgi:hypothetical protein